MLENYIHDETSPNHRSIRRVTRAGLTVMACDHSQFYRYIHTFHTQHIVARNDDAKASKSIESACVGHCEHMHYTLVQPCRFLERRPQGPCECFNTFDGTNASVPQAEIHGTSSQR